MKYFRSIMKFQRGELIVNAVGTTKIFKSTNLKYFLQKSFSVKVWSTFKTYRTLTLDTYNGTMSTESFTCHGTG